MKRMLLFMCMSALLFLTSCDNNDDEVIRKEQKNQANVNETDTKGQLINESKSDEENTSNIELTYEWDVDVKNGLLYTSEDGHIVDREGNIIDEYKDIEVLKNGALMQDGAVFDGYSSGAGGKIYCLYDDTEEESQDVVNKDSLEGTYVDYDTNETITIEENNDGTYKYCMYANNALIDMFSDKSATLADGYLSGKYSYVVINDDKSLSITSGAGGAWGNFVKTSNDIVESGLVADESGICTDVEYGEFSSYMRYDGDVLDELLAGAWYDELGYPLADEIPKVIGKTYPLRAIMAQELKNFEFIQGNLDYIRRYKEPSDMYSYAVLIQNVQKVNDGYGGICYQGTEYFSKEIVIFHGNFNGVMNGDDLIMFGTYTGMGIDDTVNFEAYYLELHNDEF